MPASTMLAQRNDLKPSFGRIIRLINRWSFSTMLFRYLDWRNWIGTPVSAMTLAIAAVLAPLLSIVIF